MAKKKRTGRIFKAIISGGASEVVRKANKKGKLTAIGKKLGSKVKRLTQNIASNAVFAPLLPFKPLMKSLLKKKGVNTDGMNMAELSKQFYNKIAGQKQNFEPIPDHYDLESDNFVTIAVDIVKVVLGFVKGAMDKKKANAEAAAAGQTPEPLSPSEEAAANAGDKVVDKLQEKEIIQDIKTDGKMNTEPITDGGIQPKDNSKMFIIIIVMVVVAFIIFRKK